jgi:hypothetical protein
MVNALRESSLPTASFLGNQLQVKIFSGRCTYSIEPQRGIVIFQPCLEFPAFQEPLSRMGRENFQRNLEIGFYIDSLGMQPILDRDTLILFRPANELPFYVV